MSDYVDYMMYVKLCAGFPQYGDWGLFPLPKKLPCPPIPPPPVLLQKSSSVRCNFAFVSNNMLKLRKN